jgi:hypothetical protein
VAGQGSKAVGYGHRTGDASTSSVRRGWSTTFTITQNSGTTGDGQVRPNGFQIVSVPEPASAGFPGLASLVLLIMLNHWIQHRGQLSTYLRLLGERVPYIYGPSADESPFG